MQTTSIAAHWTTIMLCLGGLAFALQEESVGGCGCMPRAPESTGPPRAKLAIPGGGMVNSFAPQQRQAAPRPTIPPVAFPSCFAECPPGANGPSCAIGTPPSGPVASGLSLLASTLATQPQIRIEPPAFLRSFQMAMDPCKRGATLIDGGRLTNSGLACTIRAPYPPLSLTLRVDLPATLEGALEKRGNITAMRVLSPGAELHFLQRNSAAAAPHQMEARFGGPALMVETDGRVAFVRTRGGCVGAVMPQLR